MKKILSVKIILLLLISLLPSAGVMAQEKAVEKTSSDLLVLPDDILSKKKEGWYPGVLPIYNYTSDNGHGGGLRVIMFNNGAKDDDYFKNTPYFYKITVQGYATTLGWQYHFVEADMPYFMGTKFRVRTSAVYDKTTNANFFGIGPEYTDKFRVNGYKADPTKKSYDNYADYYKEYLINPAGNPENFKYDKYSVTRPKMFLNGYTNITRELKVMAGVEVKKTNVTPWGGKKFDLEDEDNDVDVKNVVAAQTRLEEFDLQNQEGWINSATLGIAYDTRDFEPDPKGGAFVDYTLNSVTKAFGADFNYTRSTFAARYYYTPSMLKVEGAKYRFIPTLAMRGVYSTTTGDIPFTELGTFVFMFENQNGLGGNRTLRGYKGNRFIGKTMTNANIELRMELVELSGAGQRFVFKPLIFAETGSVFNKADDPFKETGYYHHSFGGGMAIAWNQSLIIHIYYGVSSEDTSFSLDIGHAI